MTIERGQMVAEIGELRGELARIERALKAAEDLLRLQAILKVAHVLLHWRLWRSLRSFIEASNNMGVIT